MRNNIVYCPSCAKQVIKGRNPDRYDKYYTKLEGGRAGFNRNEIFCGYCAEEMDEYGRSPEERED